MGRAISRQVPRAVSEPRMVSFARRGEGHHGNTAAARQRRASTFEPGTPALLRARCGSSSVLRVPRKYAGFTRGRCHNTNSSLRNHLKPIIITLGPRNKEISVSSASRPHSGAHPLQGHHQGRGLPRAKMEPLTTRRLITVTRRLGNFVS
jgi:hypothetical protein